MLTEKFFSGATVFPNRLKQFEKQFFQLIGADILLVLEGLDQECCTEPWQSCLLKVIFVRTNAFFFPKRVNCLVLAPRKLDYTAQCEVPTVKRTKNNFQSLLLIPDSRLRENSQGSLDQLGGVCESHDVLVGYIMVPLSYF